MSFDVKSKAHFIDVYIAEIPKDEGTKAVYPIERENEIRSTRSDKSRREKYYAWRLLEYAVRHSFDISIEELSFFKKDGRWSSYEIDFSLSHSQDAVAVAVSFDTVGVDIECIEYDRGDELANRFFTEAELSQYLASELEDRKECFARIWTAKEAVFKSKREESFSPSFVDSTHFNAVWEDVLIGRKRYICAVVGEARANVRFHKGIKL